MVFKFTMTPPTPKAYFPVEETKYPSIKFPTMPCISTDTTLKSSIDTQYGNDITILFNYIEIPSMATLHPSTKLSITSPAMVSTIENQTP